MCGLLPPNVVVVVVVVVVAAAVVFGCCSSSWAAGGGCKSEDQRGRGGARHPLRDLVRVCVARSTLFTRGMW